MQTLLPALDSHPTCSALSPAQLIATLCLAQAKYLHTILEPSFYLPPGIQSMSNQNILKSDYFSSLVLPSLLATIVSHLDDDDSPLSHPPASGSLCLRFILHTAARVTLPRCKSQRVTALLRLSPGSASHWEPKPTYSWRPTSLTSAPAALWLLRVPGRPSSMN